MAQADSLAASLRELPNKYLQSIEKKADKYSNRITDKTEKTLVSLSKWESKIQGVLVKVNPEAARRLFSNNELTFSVALVKFREGKTISVGYRASYDRYRDELVTKMKYLEDKSENLVKKYLQPLAKAQQAIDSLDDQLAETEAVEKFIKERRKLLITESVKYIGKSKYLQKINKESFYYTETLKNYRDIFRDKKKAEETAIRLLNQIPAFKKFMRDNSMLSSLFQNQGDNSTGQSLAGLQTRASINLIVQARIPAGGQVANDFVSQNLQAAQSQLTSLKDKFLQSGTAGGDLAMPAFKPNMQKTKTFLQRLEYGFNFQIVKSNLNIPGGADIGLSIGYKLNDKAVIGVGTSYKLSIGSIDKIRLATAGMGLRSFMDWKIRKQFFMSGGFEMNYISSVSSIQYSNVWAQSGLIGLTKKVKLKTKFTKAGKLQLLYDFLAREQLAKSPIVFRVGYEL
jgi:hypothetical protein